MPFEFETAATGFDLDNGYFLATACEISYVEPDKRVQQAAEKLELKEDTVKPFDVPDPDNEELIYRGFVGATDEISVLIFSGTDNLDRWLTDATLAQKPGLGGQIHKGFAETLDTMWDTIEPLVSEQESPGGWWLAGHGLGGALAVLAAPRLDNQGVKVRAVYTFGAPRVGNVDFYHRYELQTFRVVFNNDIYAHLPPEEVCIGGYHYYNYKHVGTLRYFDRHKQFNEGTSNWVVKKALIRDRLKQMGQPPTSWFEDHHIANYVQLFAEEA